MGYRALAIVWLFAGTMNAMGEATTVAPPTCSVLLGAMGVPGHETAFALAEEIGDNPDDDASRAVLNDAFDDSQDRHRAEFYRIHQEYERIQKGRSSETIGDADRKRLVALAERAAALFERHGARWFHPIDGTTFDFNRGLVTDAAIEPAVLAPTTVDEIFRFHRNLTKVSILGATDADGFGALLRHPLAKRLRQLDLFVRVPQDDASLALLAGSTQLRGLFIADAGDKTIATIASSELRLQRFASAVFLSARSLTAMGRSPVFAHLVELEIGLGAENGMASLCPQGRTYPELRRLTLRGSLGPRRLSWFTPERFPKLESLVVDDRDADTESVRALVERLPNLKYLVVRGDRVHPETRLAIGDLLRERRNAERFGSDFP